MDTKQLTSFIDQISNAQFYIREYLDKLIGAPPMQRLPNTKHITLTNREYEILFLKFIGKSDYNAFKYIGKIHGHRAERTAIKFKHQLFNKLWVYSNDELIDTAIALNLVNYIPESFIERFYRKSKVNR